MLGLGLDGSVGCCIIDTFAYDHSMAEAIMRLSSNTKLPSMLCVGLVWAEANTRDPNGANRKVDAAKVANWLCVALKRRLQASHRRHHSRSKLGAIVDLRRKSYHAQFEFC